jgi:hypothetical protein
MMTEGVIVMTAPTMRLKPVWAMVGKEPSAWRRVVYEAIMIGGSGGRAGSEGALDSATEPGVGW